MIVLYLQKWKIILYILSTVQGPGLSAAEEFVELKKLLEKEITLRKVAEEEVKNFKCQQGQDRQSEVWPLPCLNKYLW